MPNQLSSLAIAVLLWAAHAGSACAIAVGEQDNFLSSLEGWNQGGTSTPSGGVTRAAAGGPAGAGDAYMQIVADGLGDHGGLVAYNRSPAWTGNYITAGVTSLWMSVRNFGATDLKLRLAFGTSEAPGYGGSWLSSTTPINLPAGSGWTAVQFPIAAGDLTAVQGSDSHAAAMSRVAAVRILHSDTPSSRGPFISANLGVDNILAVGSLTIPGDFDNNLIVNGADLAEWRADFGENGNSDADADGDSDGRDVLIWQRQLGATNGVVAVPEPATLASVIGATGLATLSIRHARRGRTQKKPGQTGPWRAR